jgi:hypothetical protein
MYGRLGGTARRGPLTASRTASDGGGAGLARCRLLLPRVAVANEACPGAPGREPVGRDFPALTGRSRPRGGRVQARRQPADSAGISWTEPVRADASDRLRPHRRLCGPALHAPIPRVVVHVRPSRGSRAFPLGGWIAPRAQGVEPADGRWTPDAKQAFLRPDRATVAVALDRRAM